MAVITKTTDYILSDDGLNFTPQDNTCTLYAQSQGFLAIGNCRGSGSTVAKIISPAFPIPFNQRIIAIGIKGTYSGPRGSITGQLGLTTNEGNAANKVIPVGGGGYEYYVSVDSGAYGVQSPIYAGVVAPADGGITLTISHLIVQVLEDDTLDPGTPPGTVDGAPPQVEGTDCNVEINYQYGIGPNCTGEGAVIAIRSGVSNQGNFISMIFTPAVDFKILYIDGWDYTAIRAEPYFIIEEPLGTQQLAFGVRSYRTPVDINAPLKANKLEIFGPLTGQSYIVYMRISKEYVTDVPGGQGVGGSFPDTSAELNGIRDAIIDGTTTTNQTIVGEAAELGDAIKQLFNPLGQENNPITNNISAAITNAIKGIFPSDPDQLYNLIQEIINIFTPFLNQASMGITDWLNSVAGNITTTLNNDTNNQNDVITPLLDNQGAVINNLLRGNYANSSAFYDALRGAGAGTDVIQFAQNAYTLVLGYFNFLKVKADIASIVLQQITMAEYTPMINDMSTSLAAFRKGFHNLQTLYDNGAKHGLNQTRVQEIVAATRPLPGFSEIQFGFQRGYIPESQVDAYLIQYGFDLTTIKLIKDVYNVLPSPSDITRIADKHIFSGDIPQVFGQNSELDTGYTEAMQKWGIPPDWTQKLWAAHWGLPSFEQAFDMWHRGHITDAELNTFFALTDIMPFFREKLKLLSNSLIGRVDIRRFYGIGVYSQADVFKAYKKLGYDDEDATTQTQFTVEHERQSEAPAKVKVRTLTEGLVVKGYKTGNIPLQEAINRLGAVGYLPADAELILRLESQIANTSILADKTQHYHDKTANLLIDSLSKGVIGEADVRNYLKQLGKPDSEINAEILFADLDRITHLKTLVINHVKTAYSQGMIDKPTAINLMTTQGFSMGEVNQLLEELDILITLRNKPLTDRQISDLYAAQIIDVNTVMVELSNLGYTEQHVLWLTQQITGLH